MKRMLFNATQAEELRVAIVDGQELIDLDIETIGKEQRKGNIYKGLITRVEPSLEACFVDYGTDRHGFLPFKEISRSYFQDYTGGRPRIQEVIHEGSEVIVQVEKDERGNKGAALTTFVSLAGRYLVLMPNNPRGGGVSRRIEGEERQDLKEVMRQLSVPSGMSLIARTAGIGRTVEELDWDLNYLLQLWDAVERAGKKVSAPEFLLKESSLMMRALRDYFQPDIGEILIDTVEVYKDALAFVENVIPRHINKVKLYKDHTPLFNRYQIEHQIESAFARSVSLPSGGAIVIDHTEALVSIDVNSARATRGADIEETAFKTNMEAAEEIARQLRLRDLGGLIVIDFIDMENSKNQKELEQVLRSALQYDRARIQMDKLSRFGLLEMSRQRLRPSLGETSHIPCPRCYGTGFIRGTESSALHILRMVQEEAMKDNTGEIHAQVPVDVATFLLNEKRAELFAMEERLGVSIILVPNIHLETPHYKVIRVRSDDIDENADPSYKRVEKPEEEEILNTSEQKIKSAQQQIPVVKGITRSLPAPAPEKSEVSVLGKFTAWVKGLFAEEKPEEEKQPAKTRNNNQGKRNQNYQRKNGQNDNRRNNRPDKENSNRSAKEKPELDKNTGASTNKVERRNPNRVKNKEKENAEAVVVAAEKELVVTNKNEEGVVNNGEKDAPTQNKRRRNPRRDRNRSHNRAETVNHQTEQEMVAENVASVTEKVVADVAPQPSTKSEFDVDIKQAAHKVNQSIERVTGHKIETGDLSSVTVEAEAVMEGTPPVSSTQSEAVVEASEMVVENVNEAVHDETVLEPSVKPTEPSNAPVQEQQVAQNPVEVTPYVFEPEKIDLGHLVMVQTKADSMASVQQTSEMQPILNQKRRKDVIRDIQVEKEEVVILQQIETRKD